MLFCTNSNISFKRIALVSQMTVLIICSVRYHTFPLQSWTGFARLSFHLGLQHQVNVGQGREPILFQLPQLVRQLHQLNVTLHLLLNHVHYGGVGGEVGEEHGSQLKHPYPDTLPCQGGQVQVPSSRAEVQQLERLPALVCLVLGDRGNQGCEGGE